MKLVLSCMGVGAVLLALTSAVEAVEVEELVAEARLRNPEIQAARQRAAAAALAPDKAGALEDPMFSYETWNTPNSFRVDQADNNILSLSQKLPFFGKRGLARKAAEQQAESTARMVDAVVLDVEAAVKRAYLDLWQAQGRLQIYRRERTLAERIAWLAQQKYGVGTASQTDAVNAQVELTRLVHRTTVQQLAIDNARAELNALLSRDGDAPLGEVEEPDRPELPEKPDALIARALAQRPELAAQQTEIARGQTEIDIAHRDYYPDFEVRVSRFINYEARDGFGAMASVSIPLVNKGKYDAEVAAARAEVAAAQAQQRQWQDRVRREVIQALLRAHSSMAQHDLFESTHIPQAEQAMRVAESAYVAGPGEYLSVVESARTVEMVHVEHIDSAAEFHQAVIDLERAIGGPLDGEVAGQPSATDADRGGVR